jgi:excisionase family DNA binding protein
MAQIDRDPSCCFLTSGDIARSLKVDLKTVHRWVRRGALHGQRTRGGHLRFRHVEVVRFLRNRRLRIPDALRVPSPRMLSVGLPVGQAGPQLEVCPERLFDTLLQLVEGEYDIAALGLDDLDLETAVGFVKALRRHDATREVAVVVVSHWPERRQALSAAGADLAIGSAQELLAAVSVLTGTPVSAEHRHAAWQNPSAAAALSATGAASAYAAAGAENRRALAG